MMELNATKLLRQPILMPLDLAMRSVQVKIYGRNYFLKFLMKMKTFFSRLSMGYLGCMDKLY